MASVQSAQRRSRPGIWATIKQALSANTALEFTRIPVRRAMLLLAIPMMAEMMMESIFAVVDIFFVARIGPEAVAAVGLTEALMTLVVAVGMGLATATTAMIARRIGEGRPEAAGVVAGQALLIGLLASLAVGFVGLRYGSQLLGLMGADTAVVDVGGGYTTVMLAGSLSLVYLFLANAIFRGAGDAALAFRALWLANGINLVLDPLLIFGLGPFPEMGVTGAAVASSIGRSVGALYGLTLLLRGTARVPFALAHLRPVPRVALRLCRVAASGIMQILIATSSWVILMSIVARHGSLAVAGYTIAVRVIIFTFLPAWGLGNAAGTLVGQFLGAGRPRRAEAAAWVALRYNVVFLTVVGMASVALAAPLIGLFTSDAEVIRYGASALTIISLGYPCYAIGMVLVSAINGAGDTDTPLVINGICFWLIQIPLAWWLATDVLGGANGVFWAVMLAESVLAGLAWRAFRRGRWKSRAL